MPAAEEREMLVVQGLDQRSSFLRRLLYRSVDLVRRDSAPEAHTAYPMYLAKRTHVAYKDVQDPDCMHADRTEILTHTVKSTEDQIQTRNRKGAQGASGCALFSDTSFRLLYLLPEASLYDVCALEVLHFILRTKRRP